MHKWSVSQPMGAAGRDDHGRLPLDQPGWLRRQELYSSALLPAWPRWRP